MQASSICCPLTICREENKYNNSNTNTTLFGPWGDRCTRNQAEQITKLWFIHMKLNSCFFVQSSVSSFSRYKNKCGGDLSKTPIANSIMISPPTCCTTSTVQHVDEHDRWDLEKDGRTSSSTKPTLISLSSLFFLFKLWFVQTHSSYSLSL